MKKLLKSVIPSIIGSGLTIAVFLLIGFNREDSTSILSKAGTVTGSQCLYTVKENGEFVPLDFTGVSKEVMNSVVHIRSVRKVQSDIRVHFTTINAIPLVICLGMIFSGFSREPRNLRVSKEGNPNHMSRWEPARGSSSAATGILSPIIT